MSDVNLYQLCRICLNESHLYSNIYCEKLDDNSLFYEMVNDVCQLDVCSGDGFPEYLCCHCYVKVLDFEIFKRRAHDGRATFQIMKEEMEKMVIKFETLKETEFNEEDNAFDEFETEITLSPMKLEYEEILPTNKDSIEEDNFSEINEELDTKAEAISKKIETLGHQIEEEESSLPDHLSEDNHASLEEKFVQSQGPKRSIIECNLCGKLLSGKYISRHMQLHFKERECKCNTCDKVFFNILALKRHSKVHKDRSFPCTYCSKVFYMSSALKTHMRLHTREFPFKCTTCGKIFTDGSNLRVHTRIHTGAKPYACQLCGKNFTHLASLKIHCRVHSGERPYACDICGKGFYDSSTFKRHRRTHGLEK